jgi:hypothetical protein
MRKHDHQEAKSTSELRLWIHAEAVTAVPYLRALAGSLREHWLEMQQARRQIQRLDARPGRPDRQTLLLRESAGREAELAEDRVVETLHELTDLDVFCRDPAKGLILVPCQEGGDVAWFVFDLFAPQGQELSRFHADPLEARRGRVGRLDPGLVDELFGAKF